MSTPPATAKRSGGWSTPLLFLSFGLVLLILFNRDLQIGLGRAAGFVLSPLLGFGGRIPILTIFLASVLLVVLTTLIRHFLVDWTAMARTQEAMRSFQKEFSDARKSNNTYKLKKLTEAQPQVFELQAAVQKDQFKPMIATMLLVIPLFAWLGSTMSEPVHFALVEGPELPAAVVVTHHQTIEDAFVAGAAREGQDVLQAGGDRYAYALRPPGQPADAGVATIESQKTGKRFHVPLAPAPEIPASARADDLAPGTYTFTVPQAADGSRLTMTGAYATHEVDSALLVFVGADGRVAKVVAASRAGVTATLDASATVYAVVTDGQPGGENAGATTVEVSGAKTASWPITPEANVLQIDPAQAAPVHPYSGSTPWNPLLWSLQQPDGWFGLLPHWIVLYSLFGIPIGQIAQRTLKLWEYRHVDLDGDGKPAGGS